MIPVSLNLKNFMSYQSLDLDFSDIHVACLSGENGAGKSSILDAITWCIWEEARASHNDDLIKLGETETNAELIFDIDDQRYKIIRGLKKSGKKKISVQSTIELQIFSDNGYRSITGKSVTETKARILDIVKMKYDTFINSAFILQGRADAFTTKKPSERKQLLAEILNLDQYAVLQDKAKEKLKSFNDEKVLLGRETEHAVLRIKDEDSLKELLFEDENKLPAIIQSLTDIEEKINISSNKKQEINLKLSNLIQIKNSLFDFESEFSQKDTKIKNLELNALSYEEYISKKEYIETNFNLLTFLKNQEGELSDKLIKSSEIDRNINELKKIVDLEKHKLEIEITNLTGKIERLEKDKKEWEKLVSEEEKIVRTYTDLKKIKDEQREYQDRAARHIKLNEKKVGIEKKLQQELNNLKIEENSHKVRIREREEKVKSKNLVERKIYDFSNLPKEIEDLSTFILNIKEHGSKVRVEKDTNSKIIENKKNQEIKVYIEKIEKWSHIGGGNCPMCETFISDDDKQTIITKYKNLIESVEIEISSLEGENVRLEKKINEFILIFKSKETEKKEKELSLKKLVEYQRELEEINKAEKELISIKRDFQLINEKISNKNFSSELQDELIKVSDELNNLDYNPETLSVIQAKIHNLEYAEIKYSQLETAKKKLFQIGQELPDLYLNKQNAENIIKDESFAKDNIDKITTLKNQLTLIGYDSSSHSQIRSQISVLNFYEEENQELQKSLSSISAVKDQMDSLKVDIEKLKVTIDNSKEQIGGMDNYQNELKDLQFSVDSYVLQKQDIIKKQNEINSQIYRNKEKLDNINELKNEISESQKKYEYLDKEIDLYKELAEAFGKNGIQSLIIENAIPEIENYANALLSKMTEGRMNIKFSTIKANKSNDNIRETLDIYISDELGTRNYEMYSGGEAFRVNFAIRLALSKMLAKRAGTKLKTLIIDEGFGTQDSKGISSLIDAIDTIEKDFAKIMIITHINELKEAFPTRIEVFKTIHGSEVRLVS